MATTKKSFLLYKDTLEILDDLTNEQRGQLFYAIYKYSIGETIEVPKELKMVFILFKKQLDRDDEKYKNTCKTNSKSAFKRWNANASERIQPNAKDTKHADSDKDSDKESDSVKEQLLAHTVWRQELLQHHNIEEQEYLIHLKDFIATESLAREFSEVQLHWKRWLNKRDLKKKKRPPVEHWNADLPTGL